MISVVIPTYRREKVLLNTIKLLTALDVTADEIIVVDQTQGHLPETVRQLQTWHHEEKISWICREKPSITEAMNCGLAVARNNLVLFLDDDIIPHQKLVINHERAHQADESLWATVGQVIQPWQQPAPLEPSRKLGGLQRDYDFPFHSSLDANVENVMAGNLCVNRRLALSIGGFDENFVGSAFRFETEFARRIIKLGGTIRFIGSAGIDHLRVETGGTRSASNHMTSASALHGFGDYYYAFKHGVPYEAWKYCSQRFFREVKTRFHLTHPWWIPVKLLGEARAILMAWRAAKTKPKLFDQERAA